MKVCDYNLAALSQQSRHLPHNESLAHKWWVHIKWWELCLTRQAAPLCFRTNCVSLAWEAWADAVCGAARRSGAVYSCAGTSPQRSVQCWFLGLNNAESKNFKSTCWLIKLILVLPSLDDKKKCKTECNMWKSEGWLKFLLICNKQVIISWISNELNCEKCHINNILSVVLRSQMGWRGYYSKS